MPRSRASAKAAGTRHETLLVNYLSAVLDDDRIERRAKNGALDRGDIASVRAHGQRLVIEAKDYGGRYDVGTWLREAETERVNDGALAGVVIAKRRGTTDPGDQVVIMTTRDLVALISGTRPR